MMRIHTDTIARADLHRLTPAGTYPEVTSHGSRKRDHAFEVALSAEPGHDAHGIKRCYARNSGQWGAEGGDKAATYIEWGDWMVELFKLDRSAIIGHYDGADDFVTQTHRAAPHRPDREQAERHADRWSADLYYTRTR